MSAMLSAMFTPLERLDPDHARRLAHGLEPGDALERAQHGRFLDVSCVVMHHRHRLAAGARPRWIICSIDTFSSRKRGGDVGDHARPVHHHQPHIIGALVPRHRRRSCAGPRGRIVEAPAPARPRAMSIRSATTAEAVGSAPGAAAFEHDPADEIALDHHGVEDALDMRDRRRSAAPCRDGRAVPAHARSAAPGPAA